MKYIIYILIIGGMAAYVGRHWIQAHLVTFFIKLRRRKNEPEKIDPVGGVSIYPVGTVRTFSVRFDIIEKGDGSAVVKLAKAGKGDKIEE